MESWKAARKAARESLRGEGELILDIISEAFIPKQWAEFLSALLEAVAASGERGLAQKLVVGAGAPLGSALHEATRGGHGKLATDLLQDNGASVNAKNEEGDTPLHVAAEVGDVELVKVLLPKAADKDVLNRWGVSPLHVAAESNSVGVAQALLDAGADVSLPCAGLLGWSAAHMAARKGHVEFLGMLIANGADVHAVNRYKRSPLHIAAHSSHGARVINTLVEARANLETQDNVGNTPLHAAALHQCRDAMVALLKHGAEVNARNLSDETPLHIAVSRVGGEEGAAEQVDLLLRAGADETIVDTSGQIAVDIIEHCVEEDYESLGGIMSVPVEEDDECMVGEIRRVAGEMKRVRNLLENAPADRAWRRRGYLVLCRAHPERVQLRLRQDSSSQALVGGGRRQQSSDDSRGELAAVEAGRRSTGTGGGCPVSERTGSDWTSLVAWVLHVQEGGVFRMITGYL